MPWDPSCQIEVRLRVRTPQAYDDRLLGLPALIGHVVIAAAPRRRRPAFVIAKVENCSSVEIPPTRRQVPPLLL